MPTYRKSHTGRPWRARAHRLIEGVDHEWSLGSFATMEEAWEAEQLFDVEVVPRRARQYGPNQKSLGAGAQ